MSKSNFNLSSDFVLKVLSVFLIFTAAFFLFYFIFSSSHWVFYIGAILFFIGAVIFLVYPYYIIFVFLILLPYFFLIHQFKSIGYVKGPAIMVAGFSIPALISKFKFKIKLSELELFLIMFLIGNAIALLTFNEIGNSFIHFALFMGNVLFYIIVVTFVNSWEKLKYIIYGIIISYSINAYIAIMQRQSLLTERSVGTMSDPNVFALTLMIPLVFSILFFFHKKNFIVRLLLFASIIVLTMGIVVTVSRSALITLFLVVFLIFLQKKKLHLFILITAPIIIFFFYLKPEWLTMGYKAEELMSVGRMMSVRMRWELLMGGIKMFIEHPLIGVGPGNFIYMVHLYDVPYKLFAHNTYLEIITGSGLVGFVPFMAVIMLSLKNYYKVYKFWKGRDYTKMTITLALFISFVAYLFDILFLSMPHSSLLWGLIGFSTVILKLTIKEFHQNGKNRNRTG